MKLHELLRIDLTAIDEALLDVIRLDPDLPRESVVFDVVSRMIRSGGKRIRPMMAVVGGRFGKPDRTNRVLRVAAAVEYIHMASLIHDDIIDEADVRRQVPAVHRQVGIETAVLIADYMSARAVEWAVEPLDDTGEAAEAEGVGAIEDAMLCRELAGIVTDLCRGEYRQLNNRFAFSTTLAEYLAKTRDKTASLMAGCIRAGAEAAGADSGVARKLYAFGEALGMAFQIRDDLLDFTQQADTLGKPAGADLRNGIVTAPVIYAMEASPLASAAIRTLTADAAEARFQTAVDYVAATGALARTESLIAEYVAAMNRIIDEFAGHPAQADLRSLASYFIQ